MPKILVVTTFSPKGYEEYGRKCLQTFEQFWPAEAELTVYVDSIPEDVYSNRIKFELLEERNPELRYFKQRQEGKPLAHGALPDGKYDFLYDAVRFSHKVFALTHAGIWQKSGAYKLIWLDADSVTHAPVTYDELMALMPPVHWAAQFARVNYPETGFLMFDLENPKTKYYLQQIRNYYIEDTVFKLQHWTDCHVYKQVFDMSAKQGYPVFNLSGQFSQTSHPIIHVLGHFLDHLKGPRKYIGRSNKNKKDLQITRTEAYWNG